MTFVCVCVCVREREREREETQTERERDLVSVHGNGITEFRQDNNYILSGKWIGRTPF